LDVAEGQKVALWGLFFHSEKVDLPPDSALDTWAAKVDAALLIRVRMTD
jgi:hypothetical protein